MIKTWQHFLFPSKLLLALLLFSGCIKLSPLPDISPSEAQKEFMKICREEYDLDVKTTAFAHTLWIYLPLEESFLDIEPTDEGYQNSSEAKESYTIGFLDGNFREKNLLIEFDVFLSRKYEKSFGYTSTFSEKYQQMQQNILASLARAYAHIKKVEEADAQPPSFFVVVMADITKGLEARMLLNLADLQRVVTDVSFQEEYTRRAIMEYPTGSKDIIGDREGRFVDYHDVTWPEFLTRQILYRVKFKYERSAFPPTRTAKEEILDIVAQTFKTYAFTDFEAVQLHDLGTDSLYTIQKSELKKRHIPSEPEGRYHILQFN